MPQAVNDFTLLMALKGTHRLFGTLTYSPYSSELDKSIHTLLISVRDVTLSDAPTASLA